MSVDELFGEGGGAPAPRTGLVVGLLVCGLLLALVGLACSTAPGGVLVLLAWFVVEQEVDRVDSGYLPEAHRKPLLRLRAWVRVGVFATIGLFVAQTVLLCLNAYDGPWFRALAWLFGLDPLPVPPPAP